MSVDISKKILKIEDVESYQSLIETSQKKLVMIDFYQDWCGPCEAIQPTLMKVYQGIIIIIIIIIMIINICIIMIIDYDAIDERFVLAGVSVSKVGIETIMSSLSASENQNYKVNGCLPSFAFFRFKALVTFISGVDAPTIMSQISINMPDKPEVVEQ
jgi:thiol-disulfide isomerase/thioredoxin